MSKHNTNVPKIRFPGFTNAWEQREFRDNIVSIQTGTNLLGAEANSGTPLLKMGNIQRGYFSFNKLEYLDEEQDVEPENIAKYGDFLFNTRNTLELVGKGATWTGESGKYAFNNNIARFTFNGVDTIFFNYLYNTHQMIAQVHARAVGTTSVAAVYPRDLNSLKYYLPSMDEQKKIGEFFLGIDHLIILHQRKLNHLQDEKKGLLQKMFSKNGEDFPEFRFPGFADAWEQRSLEEVTKSYSGGTPLVGKSEYYGGDIPFIRSAEINSDTTELFISESGLNNSSAKMVQVGDILYALYGATSGEVGISKINGAINQAILAIQTEKGYDSQFIMQWLCSRKQKIVDKYLQGGQGNLSGSIVKNFRIEFPSYDEQIKIGSFFANLDYLITLHQRKLEHLQERKKALLQQMFV